MFNKSNIIIASISLFIFTSFCLLSYFHVKRAQNQKKEEISEISVSNNNENVTLVYVEDEIKSSIEKTVSDPIINETKKSFDGRDFGNGVRYFPFTGARFGEKLSEFIGSNTNLEFIALSGDDTGPYGTTKGYFVTFREKK